MKKKIPLPVLIAVVMIIVTAPLIPDTIATLKSAFNSAPILDPLPLIWEKTFNGNIICSPVDNGDTIITRTRSQVSALNAQSGEVLWQTELPGRPVSCNSAMDDEKVFLLDDQEMLVAIDLAEGSIVWKNEEEFNYGPPEVHSILVLEEYVIPIRHNNHATIINRQTGEGEGTIPGFERSEMFLGSLDGMLLIGGEEKIIAYDLKQRTQLWEVVIPNQYRVLYDDGMAYSYVLPNDNSTEIAAFSLEHRREIWRTELRNFEDIYDTDCLSQDHQSVFVSGIFFHQLDKETGEVDWVNRSVLRPGCPAVFDNQVVLRQINSFFVLDRAKGEVLYRIPSRLFVRRIAPVRSGDLMIIVNGRKVSALQLDQ